LGKITVDFYRGKRGDVLFASFVLQINIFTGLTAKGYIL